VTDAGALLLTTDSDESSSQECGGEAALRGCRGVTLAGGAAIGRRRRGARRGHGDGAGSEGFVFNGYAAGWTKAAAVGHFAGAGATSDHRCGLCPAGALLRSGMRFGFRLVLLLKTKGRIGFASSFCFGFAVTAASLGRRGPLPRSHRSTAVTVVWLGDCVWAFGFSVAGGLGDGSLEFRVNTRESRQRKPSRRRDLRNDLRRAAATD
jgi:hypothetical protein